MNTPINQSVNPPASQPTRAPSYSTITRDALKARLDAGEPTLLVEALPARYYDAEHLPGAINLPHDEIRLLAPSALPDKDASIVVYCASTECQNSSIAAQILAAAGYRNVMEFVEGKAGWLDAGYPMEGTAV
ncbi:rhodanese-like domain-containing protein [Marinobacterium rhizophilum]|uniref:Rhodanese-like domain-containing protein n=1 Tax=Marinobacterium rhizophilum TaxID=420402 RepID=A0ABY5HIJ5_9GAMM|nr:rhodanese-like domain-containing protein [Marinobacterium rhizophilum]UTW11681.1 rhodanese-like domain-containing protein [Marinobacterium rhizophilum]